MFKLFSNRNKHQSSGGWSEIHAESGVLFRYAFINRGSHIDIAIQTPKSPRGKEEDENCHLTHKLPLSPKSDLFKICFKPGKEPESIDKAQQILEEYINLYATWLETGKSIDQQIQEINN